MGPKVLTEDCKFICMANPSLAISVKDPMSNNFQDSKSNILTETSKCNVDIPLQCPILTAQSGGTAPVPCDLSEATLLPWDKTNKKIKIKGRCVLTSDSNRKCVHGGSIIPVLPSGITTITPVIGVSSVLTGDNASGTDKVNNKSETPETVKMSNENTAGANKVDSKDLEVRNDEDCWDKTEKAAVYVPYCRCDYANCCERETCDYYKTQIFIENDSMKLSNNYKTERSEEWNRYLTKHNEKKSMSSEGGWRIAAHHMISGNQVLMMKDQKGDFLYGDIVKLANYFGYDVNNAINCIMLPTNESNFGQKEPVTKIANAYEVMWLMGRQWHVGGHEYNLSKDTLENLKDYYMKNPDQYPTPGDPMFFKNYKTAMKEEMDKIQSGIRDQCWKKNYKRKREKFIASLNKVSRNVEEKLIAFEVNPRKSFPFFVSKVSVEYAYNIPATSKIAVIYNGKSGLTAKKYRVERYMKNDLKIIFIEKGELIVCDDIELIRFCENIMYFLIDDKMNYQLPFKPDENDNYVVRNIDIAEKNMDAFLQEHSNEVMAFIQQNPRQYQPITKIMSHRYDGKTNCKMYISSM